MSDDAGTLRGIAWTEIFPWLMIFRAAHLSTSLPILLLATLGTLFMPVGWRGAALLLPEEHVAAAKVHVTDPLLPDIVDPSLADPPAVLTRVPTSWRDFLSPMVTAIACLVAPLRNLMRTDASSWELLYYALGGAWNLLVWGFVGGIITRIAVMRLGREEREGVVEAARFVRRRYWAYVGSPLFALSGIACVAIVSIPVGVLLRWDVGVLIASVLWLLVIVGGLAVAIILVGLLFGWPLMWGALGSEDMGDVFEGVQRSYSYVYGRPWHYAFYALLTLVVGSTMFYVVDALAHLVNYGSWWAVSWGMGSGPSGLSAVETGGTALLGWSLIGSLNALVLTVASACRFSFLWCAAGAAYLLLRRDCDQIEYDNVFVQDEPTRYGLPPLSVDAAGVPGVDDDGPEA